MKKILIAFLFLSLFASPALAVKKEKEPKSKPVTTEKAKKELVSALKTDIKTLNKQKSTQVKSILSNLKKGDRGNAVSSLQKLLALDPSVYPEGLVTGYFGPNTERALKKFQAKYGIEQVGRVGPKTLAKINEALDDAGLTVESTPTGNNLCSIIPPGHFIAPGFIKKMGGVAPVIPTCQVLPPGIAKKLGTTGVVDTLAPTITAVASAEITATTAKITWTTNENANTKVSFDDETGTPYDFSAMINDSVKSHSLVLSGLTPDTTYYYTVTSADASNNSTTSTEKSFKTTVGTADTTAPVISAVSSVDLTDKTVTVKWTTDEVANSKVYYSTITPVDTTTASTMTKSDLETAHQIAISGLTPTTVYYYKVESKDLAGNTALSTEGTFTTTATPDTTGPVISAVAHTEVTSSGSKITWTTNENSDSKVFYSTTNPVTTTDTSVSSATMVTSHEIVLTGLTANTDYYYMVQSVDSSTNHTTSTQGTFKTLP